MHALKKLLVLLFLFGVTAFGRCADAPAAAGAGHTPEGTAEKGEHGLPANAVTLRPGGFLSNSMFVTWVVAAGLIVFARRAMKNPQPVPGGAQNFWEWM